MERPSKTPKMKTKDSLSSEYSDESYAAINTALLILKGVTCKILQIPLSRTTSSINFSAHNKGQISIVVPSEVTISAPIVAEIYRQANEV